MNEVPCLRCGKELKDADPEYSMQNQPWAANVFTSHGHWGATAFDSAHSYLEVNVCTECLRTAAQEGRVLHVTPVNQPLPAPHYESWHPRITGS